MEADKEILAKRIAEILVELGDTAEEPYVFTRDEVRKIQFLISLDEKSLRALIAFVEKVRALKWMGKLVLWFVVTAGTVIVNWDRIRAFWNAGGTP